MTVCFYCGNQSDYHPECDAPGCSNDTHGDGPEGKRVSSYCENCAETPLLADGGVVDAGDKNGGDDA